MDDRSSRDSAKQSAAPLYGLAALGLLGLILGRGADPDHPHFWALTIVAILVNGFIAAVCIYATIDLVHYLMSTTPCQRMGTC